MAKVVEIMNGSLPPADPAENTGYWMHFCHWFERDYGAASLRRVLLMGMCPEPLSQWFREVGQRNARALAGRLKKEDKVLWEIEQGLREHWANESAPSAAANG